MKAKIGLETHVQLGSKTKLFCGCPNPALSQKEPAPNSVTCDTCLGMPGTKPRVNRVCIEMVLKIALALSSKTAGETFFSRKTYFYPDMSKNFQITQYEIPLASGGFLMVGKKKIRIRRVHLEEDPAKLIHIGGMGGKYTLVDYNRSGIPLVEIVTEPDFESPEEARAYLQKLEMILEYLGVYDPSMAVLKSDANISLSGGGFSGARVEVKNITGTKETEQALKYEIVRQQNLVKRDQEIKRETRAWDAERGATHEMRAKEEEEEYGYIFEADLPMLEIGAKLVGDLRSAIPEMPEQRKARFVKQYKVAEKVAESLVSEKDLGELFEEVAKKISPQVAGGWIAGYLKKTLNWHDLRFRDSGLKREWVLYLLKEFEKGRITDRNAELVIRDMMEEKRSPQEIIKEYGLAKGAVDLAAVLKKVLEENKKAVEDYKRGEEKSLHFLVGLGMKATRGKVDAQEIRKNILKMIKK